MLDNLQLIEIQVSAQQKQPELSALIDVLRKLYPSSNVAALRVSIEEGAALITHARVIRTNLDPHEIRDEEYKGLSGAVNATYPNAGSIVSVCALAPAGPTYEVELYSKES